MPKRRKKKFKTRNHVNAANRRTAHRTTVISSRLAYPAHWWRRAENGRGEAARVAAAVSQGWRRRIESAPELCARRILYNDDNSNNNTR